jgi:hypothetical protein
VRAGWIHWRLKIAKAARVATKISSSQRDTVNQTLNNRRQSGFDDRNSLRARVFSTHDGDHLIISIPNRDIVSGRPSVCRCPAQLMRSTHHYRHQAFLDGHESLCMPGTAFDDHYAVGLDLPDINLDAPN